MSMMRAVLMLLAMAVSAAPSVAKADLQAFARVCSAADVELERVVRFCTLALETKLLGAKGQAQVLVNRGAALSSLDRPEAALADFDAASSLYPRLFEVWPNRGAVLLRLNRTRDAFESFDRALQMRSWDTPSRIGRGMALVAGGAPSRALDDFDAALDAEPNNATALYQRALAYMALGERMLASVDLSDVIAMSPSSVDALLQRGKLREGAFRDGALADYADAIRAAPDDPRPFYHRGRYLDALGLTERANADFRRAWQLGWRDEWLHERITALGG